MENKTIRVLNRDLQTHALILGGIVGLMWLIEIVDWFLSGYLDRFGVQPRTLSGLRGIVLMPLLHGGFGHLIANTGPFLVLGWLVMVRRVRDFFYVTMVTAVVSGLGIWLFGASRSVHIGASGLIFGYFGFLVFRAYFERSWQAIFFCLVAAFFYGGIIWGVLPQGNGVSWLGHLFGFIGGAVAAHYLVADYKNNDLEEKIRILSED